MIRDRSAPPPWTVPVPVRRSRFIPLLKAHEPFNVCVALGAIGAFGAFDTRPSEELLHADMQILPASNQVGRLGAGRGGLYRGAYLKGVGRTPLAGNWNMADDWAHHTGHLLASAAVREYLVSRYIAARGMADTINGCHGMLLRPLSPKLRPYNGEVRGALPANRAVQGMTLRGGPARFSNFLWLSCNLNFYSRGARNGLVSFFELLIRSLDPAKEHARSAITPGAIADAFSDAVHRTIENFRHYWQLGVTFNAVPNNFTMDGRFHDLDNAMFLGGPLLGVLLDRDVDETYLPVPGDMDFALPCGFEVFDAIRHVRQCYRCLVSRLSAIVEMDIALAKPEVEFIRGVVAALRAKLEQGHILFSDRLLQETVLGWFQEELDLSSASIRVARALVEANSAFRLRAKPVPKRFRLRRPSLALARQADFRTPRLHLFDVPPPRARIIEDAAFINNLLNKIDRLSDVDALLAATADAAAQIERRFGRQRVEIMAVAHAKRRPGYGANREESETARERPAQGRRR
jgi:hypothetical protein